MDFPRYVYEMDCVSILVFIDADLMCFKYVLKASFTFAKDMGFLLDVLREWEEHDCLSAHYSLCASLFHHTFQV